MFLHPLNHAPIYAGTKWFHQIIGQWCTPLAGDVRHSERRIQPHAEGLLQDGGKQHGITVIEKIIQAAFRPVAGKIRVVQGAAENLPEQFRADRLLVRLFSEGGFPQAAERFIIRRDVFGQRQLILAFGINGFLPQQRLGARREIEHGAGKHRIRRAVGREDEADRLERFTDDERDAMLGGFQKKIAVNACREAGDDNGRHILQRKFLFTFRRLAGQLSVPTTQGAVGGVNADDVVGHGFFSAPVSDVLTSRKLPRISVAGDSSMERSN